jgi:glutathione S-transferase
MRARLALAASQTACEVREVHLANKPTALLKASAKGTVPVLVLNDGKVLDQSWDIMLWALRRNDPWRWLPRDEASKANSESWLARNDGEFKQQLDRYKYPHRYQLMSGIAHRDAAIPYLTDLDRQFAIMDHNHPAQWGLLGAMVLPFVRQFAHTDPTWFASQAWPNLQRVLQGFEASSFFGHIMQKFPVWNGSAEGVHWVPTHP